ncbi:hypothetical protein PUR34_22175 [Streptomyces sp. JV185]|uniref:DUF6801 domain-containing protein n=1 Tax=Streptomyces sp. JV185 TaxID=858638 RepID=UPI002E76CAE7|nr:DUF6801 domain-containing protein [Streptomyces sp. JV185]MEE1770770.1 hypothetical protein [Streptomyces sp. JV185]
MRTRTTDPGRTARIAAVGAVALVAGFMPGTGAAADTRTAEADIAYTCDLPSGAQPVAVHIVTELPVSTSVGTAIQPRDVALSFELPRSVLVASPDTEPAAVSGSARVLTEVSQRGESTDVPWQGLEIPETSLPATGDLVLRATGEVPTITPRSTGDIVFALGQLDVGLAPSAAEGAGDAPPPLAVSCKVDPDQSAELATVAVPPGTGTPLPSGTAPEPSGGTTPDRSGGTEAEQTEALSAGGVQPPADCTLMTGPIAQVPKAAHGYMAGYSNVNKLAGAIRFDDPGHLRLNLNTSVSFLKCPTGVKSWLTTDGTLDYRGRPQMPPAEGTFLTFGFMPTTAKMELILDGRIEIGTLGDSAPDPETKKYKETTTAIAPAHVRLYDVKVNGEPLDVGPDCRSSNSMTLELVGKGASGVGGPEGYTVKTGGPLTGYADVPPFTGCGVTEDLDNLFTASVSGKGNYTKMMQSPLCVEGVPANCPEPPKPKPER